MNPKSKKFYVSEENLKLLYWKQELSTLAIGRKLGVHRCTINNWMRKYKIDVRPARAIKKIHNLNRYINSDFSYFIGVILGDGNLCQNGLNKSPSRFRLKVKDKAFADTFQKAVENLGFHCQRRLVYQKGRKYHLAAFDSIELARYWLETPLERKISVAFVYPESFIKGIYESEGSLFKKNYDYNSYRLTMNMGNERLMYSVYGYLIGQNYNCNFNRIKKPQENYLDMMRVELSGLKDIIKFLTQFQPCIKNKAEGIPSQQELKLWACVETRDASPNM